MITFLQDGKFVSFVEIAGAEIISIDAKKAGHTVKKQSGMLEVITK